MGALVYQRSLSENIVFLEQTGAFKPDNLNSYLVYVRDVFELVQGLNCLKVSQGGVEKQVLCEFR